MPIEVTMDPEAGVVRRTLIGKVTVDELLTCFNESFRDPRYRPGVRSLLDLRRYVHHMDAEDIRRIADFFREETETTEGARVAVVVSQAVAFGMIRMLQTFLESLPISIAIFYELGEAEDWLRES